MKHLNIGLKNKGQDLQTVTEKNIKQEVFIPAEYKGKKLICQVWSDTGENGMPVVLAKKTIKYGKPDFSVKIGGKDRFFKVNYRTKGLIKQSGKKFYYDTYFLNTTGGLSFYEYPEDMDSEEAYTAFKNNAVDMYVKKGGIPIWYLLIAMFAVVAMAFALLFIVPPAFQAQDEVKQLDALVTQLNQRNLVLQAENEQLRGAVIG